MIQSGLIQQDEYMVLAVSNQGLGNSSQPNTAGVKGRKTIHYRIGNAEMHREMKLSSRLNQVGSAVEDYELFRDPGLRPPAPYLINTHTGCPLFFEHRLDPRVFPPPDALPHGFGLWGAGSTLDRKAVSRLRFVLAAPPAIAEAISLHRYAPVAACPGKSW